MFDPKTLARTGTLRLPLRPESFQFDPSGARLFANQPGPKRATADGAIVAFDPATKQIEWTLHLPKAARNFSMALDPANHRIFVATRLPPILFAIDSRTRAILGEAACPADCDDLFYDKATGAVLVIGGGDGDGHGSALEVFAVTPQGALAKIGTLPLPPHARTGLFVPQRRAIYIAVPPALSPSSEIREYKWP